MEGEKWRCLDKNRQDIPVRCGKLGKELERFSCELMRLCGVEEVLPLRKHKGQLRASVGWLRDAFPFSENILTVEIIRSLGVA